MAESVDAADSKSAALKSVWVRVPLPAPLNATIVWSPLRPYNAKGPPKSGPFASKADQPDSVFLFNRIAASRIGDLAVRSLLTTRMQRAIHDLVDNRPLRCRDASIAPDQCTALIVVFDRNFTLAPTIFAAGFHGSATGLARITIAVCTAESAFLTIDGDCPPTKLPSRSRIRWCRRRGPDRHTRIVHRSTTAPARIAATDRIIALWTRSAFSKCGL